MNNETNVVNRPDQIQLALERTYLAYERTLLAWVRTATSLITFGFTLYKFFVYLQEQGSVKPSDQVLSPRIFGLLMIATGVLVLALAGWQHRQQLRRLQAQDPNAPVSLALILAGFIVSLGILAFVAALFRQ